MKNRTRTIVEPKVVASEVDQITEFADLMVAENHRETATPRYDNSAAFDLIDQMLNPGHIRPLVVDGRVLA